MMRRLGGLAGLSYLMVAGIAALALLFSATHGTRDVASEAGVVQEAAGALGAAVATRASLGEAVLMADAARVGLATEEAAVEAGRKATAALDGLEDRLEGLAGDPAIREQSQGLLASGRAVVSLLERGSIDEAVDGLEGPFQAAYDGLTAMIQDRRDGAAARLAASSSSAGLLAAVARFAVAFALPVLALLGHRELMRRRVRESELIAMLRAERELSRAKDEFIANISHELRTPLTSIYGFSRVLEEDGFDDPETALDLVNLIISESSELSRMVDDLLTAARADAGVLSFEIEDVDVRSEIEEVVAPFNRLGPGIRVDCEDALVEADPLRLRQIVRNLLSNGRRHGGTEVRVVGRSTSDGWFTCTVADDGPGVPPDVEDRLFERFTHRGKDVALAGGLGIGLCIVRMLTEEMRGHVTYERRGGESRFTVFLPLAAARSGGRSALREAEGADRNLRHLSGEDGTVLDLLELEFDGGWLAGDPGERGRR